MTTEGLFSAITKVEGNNLSIRGCDKKSDFATLTAEIRAPTMIKPTDYFDLKFCADESC